MNVRREGLLRHPWARFGLHYFEMVAVMMLGMLVLGGALALPLEAAGVDVSGWNNDAPALALLSMGFTMTVPMIAWMRYRGHAWRPTAEMAAAMIVPTLAAVALLAGTIVTGINALMAIEHTAMFTAMFVVMALRFEEYSH